MADYRKVFQSKVNPLMAAGIEGELAYDSPLRVTPGLIDPAMAMNALVARFYTLDPATGLYSPGGTLSGDNAKVFGGVAISPKLYTALGTSGDPLAPSMQLSTREPVEFCEMGMIWMRNRDNKTVNRGDLVVYVTATGQITTVAKGATPESTQTLIPNCVVYREPFITDAPGTNAQGNMYVIKLTN